MTRPSNDLVRDAIEMLRAAGVNDITIDRGRHIKVRWCQGGRRRTLVLSVSPSDWHARTSARATLRRMLRETAR